MEEILSSFKSEEDPILSDSSSSEGEDKNSLLASTHMPVTQPMPKKLVSRPKREAYKSKGSGPGSSSQKWSKGQK